MLRGKNVLKYILKRIAYIVLVFVALSAIIFAIYNLVPGDPAKAEIFPMKNTLTPQQYQELYAQTRANMGLDDPIIQRYFKWFFKLIRLDLGLSSRYSKPALEVLMSPLRNTILINIFVTIFALLITIPLGIRMAVKKNSLFDRSIQVVTLVGVSMPIFIVALIFIYIFAVRLQWLPVSGMNTAGIAKGGWAYTLDTLKHLVLPVMVLVLTSLASTTRYIRAAMIDALSMDYIRTARAKGVKEKTVIYSHAWRNALLPVVTLLVGWVVGIFAGSLITESMFSINGLGKFFLDSLNTQDWNVAMAIQMFYVILALLSNLIMDISYGLVDPRVRIAD